MSKQLNKPGEKPSLSGEYVESGPRGGKIPGGVQVTIESGDTPFPPTQKPGRKWVRVGPPKK